MPIHPLDLILLLSTFALCKLRSDAPIPDWATAGAFFSVTHTEDELSIVCEELLVPHGVPCEYHWRCLAWKVGVLASPVQPLAETGVSVFAISTFDTDYVLVKEG